MKTSAALERLADKLDELDPNAPMTAGELTAAIRWVAEDLYEFEWQEYMGEDL